MMTTAPPTVTTVLGAVPGDALGPTLMHEHIFVNLRRELGPMGLLNDYQLMKAELTACYKAGGRTIVDATPAELTIGAAPDPAGVLTQTRPRARTPATDDAFTGARSAANALALRDLSMETGVTIVLGTGHYRDPYLNNAWFDARDVARIAETMVTELCHGIPGTDVRAGMIGEIGSDQWYISAAEERSFRAAAAAHLRTGALVSTHAAYWPVGVPQLELLTEAGVDPSRIVIGHCDTVNLPDYHVELARRGAYVQFDTISGHAERAIRLRVGFIKNLIENGRLDQILLSQDICHRGRLAATGGGGYGFLYTGFRDALTAEGITKEEFHRMTVDNPRRALLG
jgi:phosphotriesterase-related protein